MTTDTNTDAALAEFLTRHPTCELCWTCGEGVTAATTALPREPTADEATTPWTPEDRTAWCAWCAWLVTVARENNEPIRGATPHGHPVSPEHPWNARRRQ
jgi:hypothetical protein